MSDDLPPTVKTLEAKIKELEKKLADAGDDKARKALEDRIAALEAKLVAKKKEADDVDEADDDEPETPAPPPPLLPWW